MNFHKLRYDKTLRFVAELLLCAIGRCMFALSVNVLINPIRLYSVGFTGIAQLLRTLCLDVLKLQPPAGMDLLGIIFALINVPALLLAYFGIGKKFFLKTLFITVISSVFMTVIPVPEKPVLEDLLTLCLLGGVLGGVGAGLAITAGGSGGGQDVIGVYLSNKYPNMSVGLFSFLLSCAIYLTCMIAFDFKTLAYSFIYSTVISITLDRFTYQNVKLRVEIDTQSSELQGILAKDLGRNVLRTDMLRQDGAQVIHLVVAITKAESKKLKELVRLTDSEAFVIIIESVSILGQFNKGFV